MPHFRWRNWITDDPNDFEVVARNSPYEEDQLQAIRLIRNSYVLRQLSLELSGDAAFEAKKRADDIDYDYDD